MPRDLSLAEAVLTTKQVMLDTCVLIGAFHGHAVELSVLRDVNRQQAAASVVALGEFLTRKNPPMQAAERKQRREWIKEHGIRILDFERDASQTYRSLLRSTVITCGVVDGMLAAHAISAGCAFVTRNVGDFAEFRDLQLVAV